MCVGGGSSREGICGEGTSKFRFLTLVALQPSCCSPNLCFLGERVWGSGVEAAPRQVPTTSDLYSPQGDNYASLTHSASRSITRTR